MLRHNDPRLDTVDVGQVPFAISDLESATSAILEVAPLRPALPVRLANAYCVAVASEEQAYLELLNGPGWNFPDGAPVTWLMKAKSRGAIRPSRVRGPSLFRKVIAEGQTTGCRHFFLGTTDSTLYKLTSAIAVQYPGAVVAGSFAPKFGPLDADFYEAAEDAVARSAPDIIWIALGSPKQDFAAAELAARTGVVCIGVGAAFDFVAGTAREAPRWMQAGGTEWIFRFATEPQRLWRRYVFGNLRFARVALKRENTKR